MSWHRANNITDMHAVQPICIASGRGISNCTLFSVAASRGHLEGAWREAVRFWIVCSGAGLGLR